MALFADLFTTSSDSDSSRRFVARDMIVSQLKSKNPGELFRPGCEIMIFETMRQHTWFIVSDKKLYCIIDNLRDNGPKISWSVPLSQFSSNVEADIIAQNTNNSYGLIGVLDRKVRKFSKSLYSADELKDKLARLIKGAKPAARPALSRAEYETV
ncbi:hypothetical protein [Methylobacterium oryzae]|uniref:hypothetical protein n=1 Tax=Methylobacterium oryzae TaxID=334852 RepID=UPI001F454F7D|nr:hypothetical protein [Methylobacterium oryzae]UIN38326.1 hypothetical protein LXM90_31315 [Methylobacterium oryzae]